MGYTPPAEIDIGNAAVNRGDYCLTGYTFIDRNNPANASGKITQIEIWANSNLSNCEVATFFLVSGNNFSTRDTHTIGAVTAGSKQTFSGLDITVEAGDFIGFYVSAGTMERDTGGGQEARYKSGDNIPCTNATFTPDQIQYISLYGTGNTGEGELTIGEAFSTTDSLIKNVIKQLAEAFSIADSWVARISFSEAFSIADSIFKSAVKQLTETLNVIDSKITSISWALSEAFSIADSLVKNGTEQLAEAFSIADSLVKNGIKSLAESFSITDFWAMLRRFTETLKVADSIIKKHVIIMMIRKIIIRVRGGSYESDIELED